jgi:hypothetical protein
VLDADVRARSAVPVAAPAVALGEPRGLNGRLQANAGLLALTALLLLTLLIGLLVGHWVTGQSGTPAAATPAPQVIKVEGSAAAAPATTGGSGGSGRDTTGGSGNSGKSSNSKAKDTTSSSEKATAPKGSVSVKSLKSKKAVDDAVKKGKPISTGSGKLPPKDDKPAGGGSGFEEIG